MKVELDARDCAGGRAREETVKSWTAGRPRWRTPSGVPGVGARLAVMLLCGLTLAYPVRAFLELDGLPVAVKILWIVALAAAWWHPRLSLLAFLAGAPLLSIVPALLHWPSASLAAAWLWALLLPAWIEFLWRPSAPRLPNAATVLLLVATASLIAGLYPLHLARDGVPALLGEIEQYLRTELIVATSQRPVLSPILAWVILAEGIGLLWLVCRATGSASPRRRTTPTALAVAIAAGAGVVGLWAVQQRWTHDHLLPFWVEQDPFIIRVNASFSDVNALGAYLASSLPLVTAVAFVRRERSWRFGWLTAAVCVLLGTTFTASRVAWLAAGLSSIAFAVGALHWRLGSWSDLVNRQFRRAAAVLAVAIVILLGSLTAIASIRDVRHAEQRSYVDTLLYTLNLRAPLDERFKGRGDLWQAAIEMLAARPLTGIGLGRYFKDLAAWVPDPDTLVRPQENAHNYFLQVGAELGAPGLICVLWLFFAAAWRGFGWASGDGDPSVRRTALAAALGVLAFALTCLTGHSLLLRDGQLTFWALAGLPLALGPVGGERAWRHRRRVGWLVPAAVAVVLVATLPARMTAEAGRIDLLRLTFGLFEDEQTPSGVPFRWTGGGAMFHVPAAAKVVTFQVRSLAPFPQTVQVRHANQVIQQVQLADQDWHVLRYVLPMATPRDRFRRFELSVHPTWRPPNDTRELGVMLGSIGWSF
jgi:O-antigen ligase